MRTEVVRIIDRMRIPADSLVSVMAVYDTIMDYSRQTRTAPRSHDWYLADGVLCVDGKALVRVGPKVRPVVYFASRGATGNIYALLGAARTELRAIKKGNLFDDIYSRVMACHSYDDALAIIREAVDLVDVDGLY